MIGDVLISPALSFRVVGIPAPGGSKRAFVSRSTGRMVVLDDAKNNASWRSRVALAGALAMVEAGLHLFDGPLAVLFDFTLPRPKGHYGSGRNDASVRSGAPEYPAVKPDVLKLCRSTEDALTGIVWEDDALISREYLCKGYGTEPGCLIRVWTMDEFE